ncbi:pre-toxin TG domain-containing protein [Cytobacillus massiliigabonensis]|uniref:pre-toxin TG domain-containing protein n=1 Tax=Cytobacillus massiliigabonensis TaxID=1871011 RepID=UPI000C83724F|nr:pre-toxin TG domain-containing protein [Cytobacillus massiliigabonensis]
MNPIEIDDSLWDIHNDLEEWLNWLTFVPGIGFVKGAYEASMGHDLLTDSSLSNKQRFYSSMGMIPGGAVGKAGKVAKGTGNIAFSGGRYIDQLANGIAYESKVGYTSLTSRVKTQILKDAELIKKGQINGAE